MLDLALDLVTLTLDRGDSLRTTLVGLFVELLRADAGIGLEAISLATSLVGETLSLGASLTHDAVSLILGSLHELVGVGRRDLEETGGRRRSVAHRRHRRRSSDGGRSRRRLGSTLDRRRRRRVVRLLRGGRGLLHGRSRLRDRGDETGRFAGRCGSYLGAKFLVLDGQSFELSLDFVEELVNFAHVIAFAKTDRRKTLVTHVLWRQRHEFT
ncbi:hypothetical protein GCM10022234_35060 [Aeromicrobium panaciterrae]